MPRERKNGPVSCTTTVGAAVGDAYSIVQSVRDEVQEVVDGASGTPRENTSRIQTLSETVDNLQDCDSEPEVPAALADLPVTYTELRGRRYQSRRWQVSNATSMMSAVVNALETKADELNGKGDATEAEKELRDKCQELAEEIQEHLDNFDSAEFPGMFG